ncbi:capsule assembly Wzi family protein [Marinobacter sp.]|uniref:capsule assembly Wzi family protein n=1 Tax=Marinobacter sp. TaxID=50741 RepID=UPI00384BA5EB
MSSKHWTRVGGAVACLMLFSQATFLAAAPWLEPGDPRARHAVQKLADRGHLDRTVTTWPMMWGSLADGIDTGRTAADAPSVANALAYLRFEEEAQAPQGFRAELDIAATSDPAFIRGFADTPREKGTATLDLQWQGEFWALGLSPTLARDPEDDENLRLDNTYLASTAYNWVLGAGAIDRWWGPGWQSSLILSNNARPIPAVWLNRKNSYEPETPWLSWLGPWQFTVFAGQLEEERAVSDAKLLSMRLTIRPIDGLDIGFTRAIMLGGEGRPEDASTLWNALIGRDNGQAGQDKDPGNQLGSIDIRYGFALVEQSMGLYTQMMGEDEAGAFPSRKSWLFGADATTQLFDSDQQWFVEYANTTADDLISDAIPNITFEHSIYRSGYRHQGRTMAASIDGDAEAVTLGGFNFFSNGSNLGASLTYANLNRDGTTRTVVTDDDIFYSVPTDDQKIVQATLSYGTQFLNGWLDLNARATDKEIELIGGEKDQFSVGASWRYRF